MANIPNSENGNVSLTEILRECGVDIGEGLETAGDTLNLEQVAQGIAALFDLERQKIFPFDKSQL